MTNSIDSIHKPVAACMLYLVISLLLAHASQAEPQRLSELPQLIDQYGETLKIDQADSEVAIAIVVSAKRLRRLKKWEMALRERFPELMVLRVADVPQTTAVQHADVAKVLEKRLPPNFPVGIDLNGEWSARLDVDSSVPNIVVFNADGELHSIHPGMFNKKAFAAAAADIDLLIKAARRIAAAETSS